MSLGDFVSIVSALIALVSVVIAMLTIRNSTLMKDKDIILQNYEDMKTWFEQVVQILKELQIKFPTNSNPAEIKEILVRLSAYIDIGRLYFKNKESGNYKINRPKVFRGRRVVLLDILVLYYAIYEQGIQEENKDILWGLQRAFINEMIIHLENNRFADKYVEYELIDENDIIEIKNIKNKQFKEVLLSQDIVQAIKDNKIVIKNKKSK